MPLVKMFGDVKGGSGRTAFNKRNGGNGEDLGLCHTEPRRFLVGPLQNTATLSGLASARRGILRLHETTTPQNIKKSRRTLPRGGGRNLVYLFSFSNNYGG